eukprot:CAMPEP_0202687584 /NCGR_PEP_ID=MMETSP1385-20130828/3248_1 /ASSEMBLY_ACC=CAM_ASM_000861 /TAXON_ID=933848 /ORGANISM="Elphidium margaritaceum" /LENGTH=423 /DNA_ID=CAMNT_0049342405 /DNA_START=308 /DNA_END=1579 /DNA_ORIENTATION=+
MKSETERNVIPVWQCPRCTYINIERGAVCFCGHAYQIHHHHHSSVSNSTEISDHKFTSDRDSYHTITLNDFLPDDLQLHTLDSDTIEAFTANVAYNETLDYDEDIQWIDFSELTTTPNQYAKNCWKRSNMKQDLLEAIEYGEFGIVSTNAKRKIEKYDILQQSVRKLRVIPDGIENVRCLMSDFWLSMIEHRLLDFDFQFVFTTNVQPWKERKFCSNENYVHKMRELIHHDELYRMCGFKALLCGVLHKTRASIPVDVSEMILCFLGLYEKFLPFAINTFSHSDPCNYYAQRQQQIPCTDLMIDLYPSRPRRSQQEVFVCLNLTKIEDGNQREIAYNRLLPILSAQSDFSKPRQRYYKRRSRRNKRRYPSMWPWMTKQHGRPELINMSPTTWKKEILDRPVYGDRTRYTRRKWSAFHKLNDSQ